MKIALYKSPEPYPCEIILVADEWQEKHSENVRVSEIVEVEFARLPPEVIVPAELRRLDAAEAELRNKFNEALSGLNTKRANLLALTHQAAA